jgi:O-antigen/teichoic acid export membrane protein
MLLMLWLARVLSTEQYAAFGLLYAVQTGFSTLVTAGIVEQVVAQRHSASGPQGTDRTAWLGTPRNLFAVQTGGLALVTIIAMFAVPSSSTLQFHESLWALAGGSITALALLWASLARLDHDHRTSLIFGAGVPAIGTLGAWAAVVWRPDNGAFFLGYAVGAGVALAAVLARARISADTSPAPPLGRGLRQNTPYLVVGLMMWMSGYGNLWIIDRWFSSEVVAQYTLAFTLAAVTQIAANAMNQVWSPRHYDLIRSRPPREVEDKCKRYYLALGLVVSAVAVALFYGLTPALELGGGNLSSYTAIRHGLLWLFAGYALSIPWWHAQNLFVVHGAGDSLMQVLTWSTAAGVLVWLAAMQWLGVWGLYMGYALMMGIRSLAVWWIAHKRWGTELRWEGPALACLILLVCGATA